jgi:hypothetical protein
MYIYKVLKQVRRCAGCTAKCPERVLDWRLGLGLVLALGQMASGTLCLSR